MTKQSETQSNPTNQPPQVVIIGAGPAGLTAAYHLAKQGVYATIFEADPTYVGGISRTANYKGYLFDIGGHRFFSKSQEVEDLWTELLGDDMLERPRSSRIFYNGRFFSYPLKALEALFNLGLLEASLCVLSYSKARLLPIEDPQNFEEWVSNKFGKRLFRIFFKTYTEKVWGMDCKDISADWAAQRIKGLSLSSAVKNAIFPQRKPKNRQQIIKTLIDTFRYPRKGPGMMWETCADKVQQMGGTLHMGHKVTDLRYDGSTWHVTATNTEGNTHIQTADHVISSMPMRSLVQGLDPAPPKDMLLAANSLKYRDFLTVALILKDRDVFDDNWIYIHDPTVQVGRIQNFKSWSPELIPEPGMCCYGLEYFCFEGDGLWTSPDKALIEQAKREINQIGLANYHDILDGCVVRMPKAYPVYDDHYASHVQTIRDHIDAQYPNLHLIGRNGMHKYNNQDHAMMTAMLCAENILADQPLYDLWQVNQDAEYHESGSAGAESFKTGRMVPKRAKPSS